MHKDYDNPKYNIGDRVIAIDLHSLKLYKGAVISRTIYQNPNFQSVLYSIKKLDVQYNGGDLVVQNVPETCIFRSKDEVLDWAINIANQNIE